MKKQHQKSQDKIRLTIDFPKDQHTYIKMLAAKEGVSLRQFVIEHLPGLEKKKHKDVEKDESINYLKNYLLKKPKY